MFPKRRFIRREFTRRANNTDFEFRATKFFVKKKKIAGRAAAASVLPGIGNRKPLGFRDAADMFPAMKEFVIRWFVTAFAVFVAAPIAGIQYDSFGCLLGASLLLGIANAFIRPVLL